MSAGTRRLGGEQPRPESPGGTRAPDVVEVTMIDGAAVIEVVHDPDAGIIEVVEPVVVGADVLEVSLDDLVDVEVPDNLPLEAPLVLSRRADGVFVVRREGGEDSSLSYEHRQFTASTIWLILHPLPFTPSGLVVTSIDGTRRLHPQRVLYPAAGRLRLDFTRPVTGIAHLS